MPSLTAAQLILSWESQTQRNNKLTQVCFMLLSWGLVSSRESSDPYIIGKDKGDWNI